MKENKYWKEENEELEIKNAINLIAKMYIFELNDAVTRAEIKAKAEAALKDKNITLLDSSHPMLIDKGQFCFHVYKDGKLIEGESIMVFPFDITKVDNPFL